MALGDRIFFFHFYLEVLRFKTTIFLEFHHALISLKFTNTARSKIMKWDLIKTITAHL